MKKLKLLMAFCALLLGWSSASAQVVDVSDKLVASGTNWSTFSSEKTGNSDNAPWQGANVAVADVKGACTLADFKFAEVYYDKTTGSKYTVSQTVTGLDNGIYKFRIAAFARKQNIWGDDNGKSDANNVRLSANNSSTYITTNVMAYYELVTEVTDGTLTISISGVDASNKSNWMGYTDASLKKLFSGSSYPADVKGLITNPSFDGGTKTGWTTTTSVNGNNQAWNSTGWEYWSWTAGDGGFDYYQDLTGLPNGRYTVSAKMFNDQVQKDGDSFQAAAGVYATSGGITVMKLVDVQGSSLNKYTTDEIVVTNGTLRIGAKNDPDKTMTARWFVMDEFELTYLGPVVESGTYYLYDETNGVFASRGANNGSRMNVDKYGIAINWDNWSQRISYIDWNGRYLFFDNTTPVSSWIYTDGSDDKQRFNYFAFVSTDGGYYLKDNNQTAFVKIDGSVMTPTATQGEATVWTLKTKAQHDEMIAAYPTDNKTAVITAASLTEETNAAGFETWLAANRAAKDKTSSVRTAKFSGEAGAWTFTGTRTNVGALNYGTDYAEAWQRSGNWSQTISDLPSGIYKITVNSFERANGYATMNTIGANGYEPVTAYFEANGQKVQLKSWYSEKEGTNNPNNTSEAVTAFNSDKYKNEVYAYVSDGNLTLTLAKPSYTSDSWVLFNNVTLTYYDTNVSEEDALAILEEADEQMAKPMLATLRSAISGAKATFDADRTVPNYNALRAAIDASATSVESYAAMKTNYLDPLKDVLDANNFYSSSAKSTVYDAYKTQYDEGTIANATAAALSWKSGTRYEAPVNNMLMDIWKIGNTTALTNNSGFYINSWSTESAGEGDAKDFANPFFEYWVSSGSLAANTISGKLTGLKANQAYTVTAKVRVQGDSKVAGSITMEVVGGLPVDVTAGDKIDGTSRYIKSYTATGVADAEGNLELKFNVAANSNVSWLSFRDVNYAESDVTISNDFTAINSAISAAEAHTLGFEIGEYAPYNNVNGLNAIATAKAFDKSRYYIPAAITAAASALSSVSWTANDREVNAFYKGDFDGYAEDTETPLDYTPNGWTASVNFRMMLTNAETYPGLADASVGTAAMSWSGGITYGETAGYEMPLKANTVYRLQFKAAGWNNETRSGISVSILNSTDGMALYNLGTPDRDIKGNQTNTAGMTSYDVVFATGAAGNYVFHIQSGHNMVVTDFNITKAASQILEFADNAAVPAYAPGTYPSVKITRSLTANRWATAVYPFSISNTDVDEIAVLARYNNETAIIGFDNADASTANVPFLMRSTTDKSEITLSNVAVAAANVSNAKVEEATLFGSYANNTAVAEDKGNYILSNNTIYPVGANVTVNAYRAYINIAGDSPARALSFVVGGDITGVDNVEAASEAKAKDGKFVENGKIVIVKNGKKFNANGQQVK